MIYLPESAHLIKRATWLCRIRWFAVAGILLSILISMLFLRLQLNYFSLVLIAGLLFFSNLIHIFYFRLIRKAAKDKSRLNVKSNINIQIFSDFIFLTLLLHYSGGIENPFIIFYIFHMVISSILLSKRWTYIHTTFGILLFTSLSITEYLGVLPHYSINKYICQLIQDDPQYLFSALIIFAFTSYGVVYITSSLTGKLRKFEQKLKAANSDLLEKDQIKNEYVIRVTHNIKGHIAAISSNLEVVYKQIIAPLDAGNKVFVEIAYNRANKMNEFIYDLLALTNMRLNNKFEREQIDIIEILKSVINTNKSFADSKKIQLNTEFAITKPNFFGMKTSTEEMISNLVQNAIKYTHEGGKVNLQAFSDEQNLKIVVSDSGCGIPEADLPFIFDEFYRATNIKNTVKDGTGLGLSLVKAIIERHQGTINAESTLNKGSKFTVILPHNSQI